jgi:hypothetical protein
MPFMETLSGTPDVGVPRTAVHEVEIVRFVVDSSRSRKFSFGLFQFFLIFQTHPLCANLLPESSQMRQGCPPVLMGERGQHRRKGSENSGRSEAVLIRSSFGQPSESYSEHH